MRAGRVPAPAFRLAAPAGGREAILTRVARLVAAAPPGAGLLVEGPLGDGSWRLVASSDGLRGALAALSVEFPGALWAEPGGPAPRPPRPGGVERFGTPGGRARPLAPADGPRPAGSVPPGLWLGVQSHWFPHGDGRVRRHRRYRLCGPAGGDGAATVLAAAALAGTAGGTAAPEIVWRRGGWSARRRWATGARSRWGGGPAEVLAPESAGVGLLGPPLGPFPSRAELGRHLVVFGASGSGKTTLLTRVAAEAIAAGEAVLVLDVHGDLAPAILARLAPGDRSGLVALEPDARGPGIAVLRGTDGPAEREAAFVVAALKRLSAEGPELYWGFRLERIFETLVRIAQDEGGSLRDVYALLTDVRRREASRLATRSPAVAAFLDELPAILRRNPEFLWPAAARLAKIALSPDLAALLAPAPERAVPIGATLRGGRSVALRLPMARLGPEASAFAATLLLTRAYLELAADGSGPRPVLVVLDEATTVSPRLVGEILTEGRKFGVRAVVATQYPERLAPEVRQAAAASAGTHAVFRVPLAAAPATGAWLGLSPEAARASLPALPSGWALVAPTDGSAVPRTVVEPPAPAAPDPGAWSAALDATRAAYRSLEPAAAAPAVADAVEEAVLLALYGARGPCRLDRLVGPAAGVPREEGAARLERMGALARRGLIEERADGVVLTAAGARYLGASAEHGSTNESVEHRRLLLAAFRIFAGHGERLELVRQGRYDTRLPDARLALVRADLRTAGPAGLARELDAARRRWAWRCFGGRDVHVEAEVSGAERPERIRRGWEKARRTGAFALFLVGDARRARRVAAVLGRTSAPRAQWAVWTLPAERPGSPKPPGGVG